MNESQKEKNDVNQTEVSVVRKVIQQNLIYSKFYL